MFYETFYHSCFEIVERHIMTIDIVFIHKNKVACVVNMCCSSLGTKIFNELTEGERKEFNSILDYDLDHSCIKNKHLIEKVWNACIKYGYVSEDYNIMGKFLNEMEVIL